VTEKKDNDPMRHVSLYPLTAIRVFREAVKENSFTGAASRLNVTQSAVSQRIKQIEEHIGSPLFLRQKHKLTLTEEGRFLYEASDEALESIARAVNGIISGNIAHRIVFGVLASFASKWLIPRLNRFYACEPSIQMTIRSVNHTIDVEHENAELAVVNLPSPPVAPSLSWQLLWREQLFAVCSPAYLEHIDKPLREPADLRHHTLLHDETEVSSSRNLNWKTWLQHTDAADTVDLRWGHFFTQSDLALQAAVEGQGIALARSSLVMEDMRQQRLVDPFDFKINADSSCYVYGLKSTWDIPKIVQLRRWLGNEAAADYQLLEK
jgi:LysR family glycine cleavage system transcriptional activator